MTEAIPQLDDNLIFETVKQRVAEMIDEIEQEKESSVTADENYLRNSILKPEERIVEGYPNVMPGAYSGLSERQLTGLIEYIKTLSDKDPPASDAQTASTAVPNN